MKLIWLRRGVSLAVMSVGLSAVGVVACHQDPDKPAEGPFENAGQKVDTAADKVKDGTEHAAVRAKDDVSDATHTVKQRWNDAGL